MDVLISFIAAAAFIFALCKRIYDDQKAKALQEAKLKASRNKDWRMRVWRRK